MCMAQLLVTYLSASKLLRSRSFGQGRMHLLIQQGPPRNLAARGPFTGIFAANTNWIRLVRCVRKLPYDRMLR